MIIATIGGSSKSYIKSLGLNLVHLQIINEEKKSIFYTFDLAVY